MEYVSIKQISEKWGICARRVQTLCTEGRIEGAQRVGHQWIIPADAPKPKDARVKSGKYIWSDLCRIYQKYRRMKMEKV